MANQFVVKKKKDLCWLLLVFMNKNTEQLLVRMLSHMRQNRMTFLTRCCPCLGNMTTGTLCGSVSNWTVSISIRILYCTFVKKCQSYYYTHVLLGSIQTNVHILWVFWEECFWTDNTGFRTQVPEGAEMKRVIVRLRSHWYADSHESSAVPVASCKFICWILWNFTTYIREGPLWM